MSLREDADFIVKQAIHRVLPDEAAAEAIRIVEKYSLKLSERAGSLLKEETQKKLDNVETVITGSVKNLCQAAQEARRWYFLPELDKGEEIRSWHLLRQNDAYHALFRTDGLIVTGPTGTNVNDVAVVLIKR